MKNLIIIGGTMGIGKTTLCQKLKKRLSNSVYLDGDWCWDSHPFTVNQETKKIVHKNITYLLNNFISSFTYQNIIFSWVLHRQSIINNLLSPLKLDQCRLINISLVCTPPTLKKNLKKDLKKAIRNNSDLKNSLEYLKLYSHLNTQKISTDGKTPTQIAKEIENLL